MTKAMNMTDAEASLVIIGAIALFSLVVIYYQYSRTPDKPWTCQACEHHVKWHANEDLFKLGQKNPDATTVLEAATHVR